VVALKSIMHFAFEVFYKPKYKKIRIALMAIYLGYLFFLVFIDGHRFLRMKVF